MVTQYSITAGGVNTKKMLGTIFSIIFLFIGWQLYKFRKLEASLSHIPGPPTLPLLGSGLLFVGKSPETIMRLTTEIHKKYGGIFKVLLGTNIEIAICNPKVSSIGVALKNTICFNNLHIMFLRMQKRCFQVRP